MTKTALVIGAGPAGLTAAYELLQRTGVTPVVLEQDRLVGGISRTVCYKGFRIDIGGHRFFTKSQRVRDWWLQILPVAGKPAIDDILLQRPVSVSPGGPDPEQTDKVMLVRNRLSRIFFEGKFFDYPLSLQLQTLRRLGLIRTMRIGASYLASHLPPRRQEHSLADFFTNRFGSKLYELFFKDYTQKVWGRSCEEIGADWGAQRIKGLSLHRVLLDGLKHLFTRHGADPQAGETSLIRRFLYPKYGPGQLWQTVQEQITAQGGQVLLGQRVEGIQVRDKRVLSLRVRDIASGDVRDLPCDHVFSTMPVKDLILGMNQVPESVRHVAEHLPYRNFITVGILARRMRLAAGAGRSEQPGLIPDNWLYIQDRGVRMGRLQVFNNWSPYLLADRDKVWLGCEYFCDHGDDLWQRPPEQMIALAVAELERLGAVVAADVLDGVVVPQDKAYPGYFDSYNRFADVRAFLDPISNLFLIGRNGMHRYNNSDHSTLSAMIAVDTLAAGRSDKDAIWAVNTEQAYHEGNGQADSQ